MDAIDSVEQYPNPNHYELIIVNDGSTDSLTIEILTKLETNGYQVIHQSNKGLSEARNTGIKATKGNYILPLDSDNKIRPAYIEKGISILDNDPSIGIVYGNRQYFGKEEKVFNQLEFDPKRLFESNFIDACAVFRKKLWDDIGGYDGKGMLKYGAEDWDFWMRAFMAGWDFHYVDEVLFDYHVRADSMLHINTLPQMEAIRDYIFNRPEYRMAKLYRQELLNDKVKTIREQQYKINWFERKIKEQTKTINSLKTASNLSEKEKGSLKQNKSQLKNNFLRFLNLNKKK